MQKRFYQKYNELRARIKANSCPIIPATLQQNNNVNTVSNNNQNNNNNNSNICSSSISTSSTTIKSTLINLNTSVANSTTTTTTATTTSSTTTTTTTNLNTTTTPQPAFTTTLCSAITTNTTNTNSLSINNPTTNIIHNTISNILSQNYAVQRSASLKDHKQIFLRKSPPLSPTTTPPTCNALSTTSSIHTTPITTTTSNAPAIVNTTPIRSVLINQINHEPTNSSQNEKDSNLKRSNHQNLINQHSNAGVDTVVVVDATVKEAKQTTGNIIKNFFKSFVPPVRDEESETQRKAHAKRVRETRRSTQGVTLDEIKSAEELVKKKNSAMNNNNNNNNNNTSSSNNDTQASKTSNNIPINSDSDTLAITEEQSNKGTSSSKVLTKYDGDAVNQKSLEDDDVEITASFTLMATSSGKLRTLSNVTDTDNKDVNETEQLPTENDNNDLDDGEEKEVSATFIMAPRKTSRTPTPTESHETTVVVAPPHQRNRLYSRSSSVSEDESNAEDNRSRRLRSTKYNREDDNKKTESPSPPPPAEGMRKPNTPTRQLISQRLQNANERVRSAFFNPLPLSSQHTVIATLTSPTTTLSGQYYAPSPTLGSPVRLREKRPYFEPDNSSNTTTLAEKLRSEANKYTVNNEKRNDATATTSTANNENNEQTSTTNSSIFGPITGVGSITGVGYNYTSRRSLDSSSLPSSPLHTRERESGGNDFCNVGSREMGSAGFYPAERRPSWRMKFDTGSKPSNS
uniref:Uncharacterized protein n=1 Tax=Glossina brevipalpis TaxID=37001 RepID=A0A1A9WD21_9MUSC